MAIYGVWYRRRQPGQGCDSGNGADAVISAQLIVPAIASAFSVYQSVVVGV